GPSPLNPHLRCMPKRGATGEFQFLIDGVLYRLSADELWDVGPCRTGPVDTFSFHIGNGPLSERLLVVVNSRKEGIYSVQHATEYLSRVTVPDGDGLVPWPERSSENQAAYIGRSKGEPPTTIYCDNRPWVHLCTGHTMLADTPEFDYYFDSRQLSSWVA